MLVMAWFEVDDPTGRPTSELFELIADDITAIQSRVHGVSASEVRVGKIMSVDEALADIKEHIAQDEAGEPE